MFDYTSYRAIKRFAGFLNTALPSGFYEPLGLRFVVEVRL